MSHQLWVDVETTSIDSKSGAIIQIACIPIIDMEKQDPFVSYIAPHDGAKIDQKALEISGITQNKFYTFESNRDVLDKLIAYINKFDTGFILSGHNVSFDKKFMYNWFSRNGKRNDFISVFGSNTVCTLKMAKERKSIIKCKLKLGELCRHFSIPLENEHDALADIEATIKLYDVLQGIETQNERDLSFENKNIGYKDLKKKYMSSKYVQLSANGDFYVTESATKDKVAFRFIMNELWSLYGL